jgi:heme A synthase
LLLVEAPSASGRSRRSRFALYAWFVLAYNLAVVMWGAYVRATGSGAGCGAHWPLCNGVAVPHSPALATIIEFTHRVSSTLAGMLILGLVFWAFRAFPKRHPVRLGAVLTTVFVITEGAIGAGLVLFEKTAQDESTARVVSLSVHLINTFLLVACIALTAWWASGGARLRWKQSGNVRWFILAGLAGTLLLGVSGAITALGDTLYPVKSLAEGLRADMSPAAPFVVQFRKYHPALAILVGGYLAIFALYRANSRAMPAASEWTRRFAFTLAGLVTAQWTFGALDVLLLAPYWLQLLHLFLADLLWLAAVLVSANLLSEHANN